MNFSDALMEARRKSQLRGAPLTSQEASGITEGFADTASERLDRAKGRELQEREENRLASSDRYMRKMASARVRQDEKDSMMGYALPIGAALLGSGMGQDLIGGVVDTAVDVGGAAVDAIGSGVSSAVNAISGTWLCTETKKQVGIEQKVWDDLGAFRKFARCHHPYWYHYYVGIGPLIVKGIERKEKDLKKFYEELKDNLVRPVVKWSKLGLYEDAYKLYRETVMDMIIAYVPELIAASQQVDELDKKGREEREVVNG